MFASFKRRWLNWLRDPKTPQGRNALYIPKQVFDDERVNEWGYCCLAGVCMLTGEGSFRADGSFAPDYVRQQMASIPEFENEHLTRRSNSLIPLSIAIAAGITEERMHHHVGDVSIEIDIKFFKHEIPERLIEKIKKEYDKPGQDFYTAAEMNDRGLTFLEIAEVVEGVKFEIPD